MARPKRLKSPARVQLLMDAKSKRDAFKLAFERRISLGRLVEELVEAERKRLEPAR
jgi:hypothetical protein